MVRYANGRAPLDKFVNLGGGQYLWPGTARRWKWMVAEGQRRHGVTLYISSGVNGYRWYEQQVTTRSWACNVMGNCLIAAYPGTSSHGGTWAGPATNWQTVDTGAIDVGNWGEMGWANFNRLARDAGFITDAVSPQELWHIIDLNPWVVPAGGDESEDDMPSLKEIADAVWGKAFGAFNEGADYGLPAESAGRRLRRATDRAGRALVGVRRVQADLDLLKADLAAQAKRQGSVAPRFYKHGDMPEGSSLWVYVLPTGDFVRIYDIETAALYKEMNGGFQSEVISKDAIRKLRDDLVAAGGRDLSAVEGTTDTTPTTRVQAQAVEVFLKAEPIDPPDDTAPKAADAPFQLDDSETE